MGDKLWKTFERFVAKEIFGSVRNIGSGKINSKDDGTPRSGDVISDEFEVECKCYKKISIFRWWDKLMEDAKVSKKKPVLIMKEVGDTQGTLVCMHWKDFVELKEKASNYDALCK